MTITLRATKGSALTHNEVDTNFTELRDVCAQTSGVLSGLSGVTLATGGALKSATSAGNTALLQAYNTGSASYTTFGTLTSGTSPSLTLSNITASGTWLVSGTWTLPAHTLGGAITGNGQNVSGLGTLGCGAITSTGDFSTSGQTVLASADQASSYVRYRLANTDGAAADKVAQLISWGSSAAGTSFGQTNAGNTFLEFFNQTGGVGIGTNGNVPVWIASNGVTVASFSSSAGLSVTGAGSVTSTFAAGGAIKSTGANLANEANAIKLSYEGSSNGHITVYGADASTAGTFKVSVKSSDGSVQGTPLTLSNTTLTLGVGITSISGGTNPSLNIGSGALTCGALSATSNVTLGDATTDWANVVGNLGVGTTSFGTSGTQTLCVKTGTAPSNSPADTVTFYSSDNSAGNTIPSFYCEGAEVIATGQADSASSVRVKMRFNGTVVTLLAI